MGTDHWQSLFESLSEPAWRCDAFDRVVWINPAAAAHARQPSTVSDIVAALVGPRGEDAVPCWRSALATASGTSDLDIAGVPGVWRVRIHRDDHGITAIAHLRRPDAQQLMDAVPWPMAWIDGSHCYRLVNRAYEAWFCRPAEQVIGRSLASLMGEDAYRAALPRLEAVRQGSTMTFPTELPFPDGRRRHVDITFLPDRPLGVIPAEGWVVLVQDATEHRREQERRSFIALADGLLAAASNEVETSIARLVQVAVTGFVDWCLVRRPDGSVIAVSAAGDVDRRRLDEAQAESTPWLRAVSPGDDGVVSLAGAPIVGGGLTLGSLAVGARRPLGERDVQVATELAHRIGAAIESARTRASATAARHEADQAMIELERKAAALAESNAQLEQFAYVASHDLQEPLRMVTQFLGLLERRYAGALEPKAREYIASASDGALRMQVMIRDLLTYSRTGRGDPMVDEVDTAALLRDVLRNLGPQLEESHGEVVCEPMPIVVGDRTRLACIFQNLIGNALKFRGSHAPLVRVSCRESSDGWEFSVADNGIGIDQAHQHRLFGLFQRLHLRDEYPGTGLGLAICRKLVEQAGGRIWFESTPGAGATFSFTLIRHGRAEPAPALSTANRGPSARAATSGRTT